jgi:hypothetical protein
MMMLELIWILSFFATIGVVLMAAAYWPIRNVFVVVSWLPLLMLALTLLNREFQQSLGYSIFVVLGMIFFSSCALAIMGSRILSRTSGPNERSIVALATGAALLPILNIFIVALIWS